MPLRAVENLGQCSYSSGYISTDSAAGSVDVAGCLDEVARSLKRSRPQTQRRVSCKYLYLQQLLL